MKILHTADWHLGKHLENLNRHEEQEIVLAEIERLADVHDVDAVIIAGDLFDTFNPPSESIDLLYKTCKNLSNNGTRAVIAIAGNHDSPERIEVPEHFARACGIVFIGFPYTIITPFDLPSGLCITRCDEGFFEMKLPRCVAPLRIFAIPYVNENRLKIFLETDDTDEKMRQLLAEKWQLSADKYADKEGVNIAVAHLLIMRKGNSEKKSETVAEKIKIEESDDEKPIRIGGASAVFTENFPAQFQYVALGHIHKNMVIEKKPVPFVYSGSPLAYSFNEKEQEKYVVIIEAEPDKPVHFKRIALTTPKKLSSVTFNDVQKALDWLAQHQDNLVRLIFESDSYVPSTVFKQLKEAHKGLISIEPNIKDGNTSANSFLEEAPLGASGIKQYFEFYFKEERGYSPGEEILRLFEEVLAV